MPSIDELSTTAVINARISVGDIPINDLDSFTYFDNNGGLYPWGNYLIENAFKTNYIKTSKNIRPMDSVGLFSKSGKIVILEIGASNPFKLFEEIKNAGLADINFGKNLVYINGGTGGKDLPDVIDITASYWVHLQKLLDSNLVTAAQVQVIFCIEDDMTNFDTTINRAYQLRDKYIEMLVTIRIKYPNCKLMLIGDRGYNDYATLPKFSEPKGYLNGWAVKFLIEDYIDGLLPQYPLLNWMDYYWANGETPRWDGLDYFMTDFLAPDYVHYTEEKAAELGAMTHARLKADQGCLFWYK